MKLIQVTIQKNGAYFMYQIEVQRGIKGKSKSKVKEVLIDGIPFNKLQEYCIKNKFVITNKAIYQNNDLDDPILFKEKDRFVYKEREQLNGN